MISQHGKKSLTLGLMASVAAVTVASTPAAAQQTQKPNVVFILADNVGYGDLGPYGGGEHRGAPTPNIDQMARDGLRLTQFLVEPACTPSRAALMTGQYSIRSGLSLIAVEGSPNTLSARAFTMGELFKGTGYATAIFGKWHLGSEPQSLPTAHGFDEFYGIPPNLTWDAATYVDTIEMTHSIPAPPNVLLERGPQIVQAVAGGPLQTVKPFTPEVRANIDYELVDKSIDFMRRQKAAGKSFFLYLPFSMGHAPNLTSKQFQGKSRIGQFGDKIMEGDYHVGQILDTLKELGVDNNTIVVFASDNGPSGETVREFGNQGTPDMGNSGPFRGELGEVTEGSIRTAAIIRWPGKVKPNTTTYAMFSIMDFLPTFLRRRYFRVGSGCRAGSSGREGGGEGREGRFRRQDLASRLVIGAPRSLWCDDYTRLSPDALSQDYCETFLVELYADPLSFAPNDLTGPVRSIGNQGCENARGFGQAGAAAELNRSGFQDAISNRCTSLIHRCNISDKS